MAAARLLARPPAHLVVAMLLLLQLPGAQPGRVAARRGVWPAWPPLQMGATTRCAAAAGDGSAQEGSEAIGDSAMDSAFIDLSGGERPELSDDDVFEKASEMLKAGKGQAMPSPKTQQSNKPFTVKDGPDPGRGFEMKVQALRGDFSPEDDSQDTENDTNLLAALGNFPAKYTFTAVGNGEGFTEEVVSIVKEASGKDVDPNDVVVTDRLGGKFKSVQVSAWVDDAPIVPGVFEALRQHPQVKMQF
mmetsp:Transcript_9038/g.26298  ORF Transcript_9038/g.26298 Transcript_9038/m.26298 type:complete len:246 (-) Transcript_9038:1975-2712(-)